MFGFHTFVRPSVAHTHSTKQGVERMMGRRPELHTGYSSFCAIFDSINAFLWALACQSWQN